MRPRARLLLFGLWLAVKAAAVGASFLLSGCVTDKALHASAPEDGQQGIRVALDAGVLSTGTSAVLENVGTYSSVPKGWTGPVPPGWTPAPASVSKEPNP